MERQKEIKNFLTNNYHYLASCTKADKFFSWLRSKKVLSQEDQEWIEAHATTKGKASRLIDTVMTKGDLGFKTYMEVVEWAFPHIFKAITGKEPRVPSEVFRVSSLNENSMRASVVLIQKMQNCMMTLMGDKIYNEKDMVLLQKNVQELKHENEKMIKGMSEIQNNLQKATNEIHDLIKERDLLVKKCEELNKENKEKDTKITEKTNKILDLTNEVCCKSPTSLKNGKIEVEMKNSIEKTCENKVKLRNKSVLIENHFEDITKELNNYQKENQQLKETVAQLLDLNSRLEEDFNKVLRTTEHQYETILSLKEKTLNI